MKDGERGCLQMSTMMLILCCQGWSTPELTSDGPVLTWYVLFIWCFGGNGTDASALQGVVSLELLTVFLVGPLCVWVCFDIARKNPRANILMIILATAELYGGMYLHLPHPSSAQSLTHTPRLHDLLPRVAHG